MSPHKQSFRVISDTGSQCPHHIAAGQLLELEVCYGCHHQNPLAALFLHHFLGAGQGADGAELWFDSSSCVLKLWETKEIDLSGCVLRREPSGDQLSKLWGSLSGPAIHEPTVAKTMTQS